MSQPLVSIVMPCRNAEATLGTAVASVLAQDYPNFELLVVDDASSDASILIANGFCAQDSRVKLLPNRASNRGASYARNVALEAARGDLVGFLDSDDTWFAWALSARIERMQETGAKVVYGPYLRLYPDGTTAVVQPRPSASYEDMLWKNHIGNLTGLYDARALGIEYQSHVPHEDYLMWCKLVKRGGTAASTQDRPLGTYRVSSKSLSADKRSAFLWHWNVLRDGLGVPWAKAIALQACYSFDALASRISEARRRRAPRSA